MDQPVQSPAFGPVLQVAFVVDDIEQTMLEWAQSLRVGPFFYFPHFPLIDTQYRGKPIQLDIDVALAFSGSTCFELVSQRSEAASPFRDAETGARLGFHHFASATRNFDPDVARYEREGFTRVASATVAVGGRVAFFEKPGLPGIVELMELTPSAEQLFTMVRAASSDWDGRDPIRRLG